MSAGLAVGDEIALGDFGPVTRTDIVRFAGASGDFNPLHHDEGFAKAAGFTGVFAMGMFPAGVLASAAASRFGPENIRRVAVRFKEPVWPGDVLSCSAVVTGIHAEPQGGERVLAELACRRAGGRVVITAVAEFVLSGTTTISDRSSRMSLVPRTAVTSFSLREQLGPLRFPFRDAAGDDQVFTFDNPRLLPISDFPRRALDELGVDLVEVVGLHFTGLDDPEIRRFDKALADSGVGLLGVALDLGDLLDPDDERRAGDIAVLKEWIARFAAMGSSFVRVNPGSPFRSWEGEPPAHLAAALAGLGEFAGARGTRLLVENHSGPSGDPAWLHALLDDVGGEHCGLLLDLGNLEPLRSALGNLAREATDPGALDLAAALSGLDLSPLYAAIESLAPRAELVSVKTNWVAADGTVGAVDLGRAMAILVAHGYDGALSIEYEGFGGDPWAKTRRVVDVAREAFVAAQAQ